MSSVPSVRLRVLNQAPYRAAGRFVLYWMIAARRVRFNFALQRAVELAKDYQKPLLILEPLGCRYPWASERFHRFVIEGMAAHDKLLARKAVSYHPYVEPSPGEGEGLLETLARDAVAVVTDDFPCFIYPRMVASAALKLSCGVEAVDSNGLLPIRAAETVFPTAHAFRRFLQKSLPSQLEHAPIADPLSRWVPPRSVSLPREFERRWPRARLADLLAPTGALRALPIDHAIGPAGPEGGDPAARAALRRFLDERLPRYGTDRNDPEQDATSGLSPYLHFGYLSVHEVLAELTIRESWSRRDLSSRAMGSRSGWWGMSPSAEAFLDELVTWREVGFNFCALRDDYDRYESLPDWARATLERHMPDPRPWRYELDAFARGSTHDPLWNAAQMQLVREGRIHNYLRMLWGKKILEWSPTPRAAIDAMIELNNRYALDGRDPNSYTGIFWVLGRYDRPWGPERAIFGKVRYMSSENTARKFRVRGYIAKFAPERE